MRKQQELKTKSLQKKNCFAATTGSHQKLFSINVNQSLLKCSAF